LQGERELVIVFSSVTPFGGCSVGKLFQLDLFQLVAQRQRRRLLEEWLSLELGLSFDRDAGSRRLGASGGCGITKAYVAAGAGLLWL
jgi:hypothetical protein